MKSVGERIRQARDALGISGLALAQKVGFKTQSAISNLENRASGTGGGKIALIADALNVPVEWLLRGPDSESVPFLLPAPPASMATHDLQPTAWARPAVMKFAFRVGVVQGGDNGWIEDCAAPTAQEPEPVYYASTLLDEQAYAVKVRGSSMEPAIMAGWDVVASPSRPAEPPDLCVVYFSDGRKAIKRLAWVRGGMVCLESTSATHEKITEPVQNIVRMDKVISIVPN
jgi:transcriptional regulator with XRE-family HTH domain